MSGTYNRLNLHVGASNRAVIRAARGKLAKRHRAGRGKDGAVRAARHAFYRDMIKHHADARALFVAVARGAF